MKIEPLTTTTVGSFPRPSWLAETQRGRAAFRHEGAALREAQDDATIVCLREQEELGLDVLTDGEQRRENFVYHAARAWDGVDHVNLGLKNQYRGRDNYPHMVPRIVAKISRRGPAMVEDAAFAKKHTKKPVKMAIAGPVTVIDSTYDEFYRDEAALAMDAAVAINQELRDLQAAGCDMLQIDEPAMTRYHDKVFAYGADALDRCLEGITVPTVVHLCFGYPGGRALQHEFVYPELLARLARTRIGGFNVEFGRSNFDVSALKACGDRLVMFGCVDPGDSPAPSKDRIKARLAEALKVVDPRQILVAPDCGLMTISRSLAREKVAAMTQAARELRESL